MNVYLYRPCDSDRDPVNEFGTFGYDRGASWKGSRIHRGKDVPVAQGTKLYGCGDGRVVSISKTNKVGYIWIVVIDYAVPGHGTVRVSTQHHSAIYVNVGDRVTLSTVIGLSGGTPGTLGAGNSNGAHVHIETYLNGTLINPDSVLYSRSLIGSSGGGGGGEDMPLTEEEMVRIADITTARVVDAIFRTPLVSPPEGVQPGEAFMFGDWVRNADVRELETRRVIEAAISRLSVKGVESAELVAEIIKSLPSPEAYGRAARDAIVKPA